MERFIKQILDAWNHQLKGANMIIDALTNEQLAKEIAPGKNTGIYLLGHLVTVHDGMLPLLGLSEKIHPELESVFLKHPDKSGLEKPDAIILRSYWLEVNEAVNVRISGWGEKKWFQRHTAVSEEAFEKEPHRNRLNILLSRTSHLAYHIGQMALLKS